VPTTAIPHLALVARMSHVARRLARSPALAPYLSRLHATTTVDAPSASQTGWMGRPLVDEGDATNRADASSASSASSASRTPGQVDAEHFRQGDSVAFWANWRFDESASGVREMLADLGGTVRSSADATYWAYHAVRTSWFLGQGAAGLIASNALAGGGVKSPIGGDGGIRSGVTAGARLVAEAAQVYKQDLGFMRAGRFNPPWDMHPSHRQFNPMFVADKTKKFIKEATSTLRKSRAAKEAAAARSAAGGSAETAETKVWMDSPLYPDYYLKTFHYQTDGWLSTQSAEVYEVSTETLFLGRQDAMQRTALVPLSEYMRERVNEGAPEDGSTATAVREDGAGAKLLELACGTGRFLTFVRDNYPGMDTTGLDLSPFYLIEARKNGEYWEKMRRRVRNARGGGGGGAVTDALRLIGGFAKRVGVPLPPLPLPNARPSNGGARDRGHEKIGSCEFVQAAAEAMPFPDASFDVITCVYLLHELPAEARAAAAKEAARVLKPGGLLVLADSVQLGDRPRLDAHLGKFGDFNEPHYRDYISSELVSVFGPDGAGLTPWTKELCSSTKVLSFRKPK